MATISVSDASFQKDVLEADSPVLVDFWAEWCAPCKMIAPSLDELSNEMADQLTIAKINIDENPNTPMNYSVRGIPTLLIFKGGEVIAEKVGTVQKSQLQAWITDALSR
ncbi:MAG: thioredoxin [Alphaproteobacteria bacterium]|jgi:thioredoxin 1|nr:thioredoxin [Alphaproteobacteria bacterium]